MVWFVSGLLILIGLFLVARWFTTADPAKMAIVIKWTAGLGLAALALFFIVRGRLDILSFLAFVALPFVLRWRGLVQRFRNAARNARGPDPGQTSSVSTEWLNMTLDHDSGEMTGEIVKGTFTGRSLESLSPEECLAFLDACADDHQTVSIFETWLDRRYGDEWRDGTSGENDTRGADDGPMTRAMALEILGLQDGATRAEIIAAHRRLMKTSHPDQGGSDWLATRINQARDVLLGN